MTLTHHFYRAKRSGARYCRDKLSVCPSVCDVSGLWSHALEFFENNFTANLSSLCRPQHHGSTPKGTPLNFSPKRNGVGKNVDFWSLSRRISEFWNGARYGPSYYWPLIGMCTRAFDWYQNRWPWMTLKGNNSSCYVMRLPFGAHH